MRGTRWRQLTRTYTAFLEHIQDMNTVIVSTITFDDIAHLFYKELPPREAKMKGDKLPCTWKGTKYSAALKEVIKLLTECSPQYSAYLCNIIFLSDGQSESPTAEMTELVKLKDAGKALTINTIACETEEDDDLIRMTCMLEGQHFGASSASVLTAIFDQILNPG